jgi:hypothetical protein
MHRPTCKNNSINTLAARIPGSGSVCYNFCQAGISDHVWSIDELLQMAEHYMPKPGPRGPYKKRVA